MQGEATAKTPLTAVQARSFLCVDDLKLQAVLAEKSRTIVGLRSSLVCEQHTPLKQYVMCIDSLTLTKPLSDWYCLSRRGCAVLNCTEAVESWFYTRPQERISPHGTATQSHLGWKAMTCKLQDYLLLIKS